MPMKQALFGLLFVFVCCAGAAFAADQAPRQAAMDPRQMIQEKPSPFGMDETVKAIQDNAKAIGWSVTGTRRMDQNIAEKGGPKLLPVTLVELCQPQLAGKMLLDDSARYASVMMPCTIAVYQKQDGKAYVGFMNTEMIGKIFGGTVGEVMGGPVNEAQAKILAFLAK